MSHRLQVLIPSSLDLRIRKAATRKRQSKSEWVRVAIEEALRRPNTAADPLDRLKSLGAPTGGIDQMLTEVEAGRG